MKNHHVFDLSLLALAVVIAFSVALYPLIASNCGATVSSAPRVTASVSSDTLTAASGTRLPLRLSVLNEENSPILGGSVYLTVTHNATGALVYNEVVKAAISLAPRGMATSTVFWNIPARLYPSVYTIRPLFVLDGVALKGTMTSRLSPFGNAARVSVSGDKNGVFPAAYIKLPEYAQYPKSRPCADLGIPALAAAVGGLGAVMLLIGVLRKRS